jgi:sugar (pentulose or hexulose) kinase
VWLDDTRIITASHDDVARVFAVHSEAAGEAHVVLTGQHKASGAASNPQLHPRHRVFIQGMAASSNGVMLAYMQQYVQCNAMQGCVLDDGFREAVSWF